MEVRAYLLEDARGTDHISLNGVVLQGEQDIFGNPFNSAAMAAPTRPATIKAVSTGPNSLHIETLTTASVAVSILTL